MILAELGMDHTVVAAGLLHDVLDDTPVTAAELRTVSGAAITGMVQGVSRLSHISQIARDSGRSLHAEERQRLEAQAAKQARSIETWEQRYQSLRKGAKKRMMEAKEKGRPGDEEDGLVTDEGMPGAA